MKIRKILSCSIGAVLVLSCLGCGKAEPASSATTAEVAVTTAQKATDGTEETTAPSADSEVTQSPADAEPTAEGEKTVVRSTATEASAKKTVSTRRSATTANKKGGSIVLETVYNGKTVDLCTEELRTYLSETNYDKQCELIQVYSGMDGDRQCVEFRWQDSGCSSYTVLFSEKSNFAGAIQYTVEGTSCTPQVLIPGKTYYWKVTGGGKSSAVDRFVTLNKPIRFIEVGGAANVRDMGGWKTESGKTIAYGKLFRAGRLNDITAAGKDVLSNRLKITTELDLRSSSDDDGQSASVIRNGGKYMQINITQYDYIFNKTSYGEAFRRIFTLLAAENYYPVLFHCNAGADRTGTLAFLLGGMLGVSYEDLTRDFEASSFGGSVRWRGSNRDFRAGVMQSGGSNYIAWGKLHDQMLSRYPTADGKLSSSVTRYLTETCGISAATLDKIKKQLLV